MTLSINTVKEVVRPLGRPGYAYDFPVTTQKWNPEDLKPLIGREVYIQSSEGEFAFLAKTDKTVVITDISSTHIYVRRPGSNVNNPLSSVSLDQLALIEWSETVRKRITIERPV